MDYLPAAAAAHPDTTAFGAGALVAFVCNLVNNLPLGLIVGTVASGAHLSPHVTGCAAGGRRSGTESVGDRLARHDLVAGCPAARRAGGECMGFSEAGQRGDAVGAHRCAREFHLAEAFHALRMSLAIVTPRSPSAARRIGSPPDALACRGGHPSRPRDIGRDPRASHWRSAR